MNFQADLLWKQLIFIYYLRKASWPLCPVWFTRLNIDSLSNAVGSRQACGLILEWTQGSVPHKGQVLRITSVSQGRSLLDLPSCVHVFPMTLVLLSCCVIKLFNLKLVLWLTHCGCSINIKSLEQSPAMGLINQAIYIQPKDGQGQSKDKSWKENILFNLDLSDPSNTRDDCSFWVFCEPIFSTWVMSAF